MYCNSVQCINSSNVSIGTSTVTITVPGNICNFVNLKQFCIYLNACVQLDGTPRTVQMVVNGQTLPVLSKCGNTLYSDQLRKCQTYRLVYGNNTPHILVLSNVCPTSYVATTPSTPSTLTNEVVDVKSKKTSESK